MPEVIPFCTTPIFLALSLKLEGDYWKKKIRSQKRISPPIISSSHQAYIQCLIISEFKSWSPSNPYQLSRNQWTPPSGLQEISFSFIITDIQNHTRLQSGKKKLAISIQLCQSSFLSLTFFPPPYIFTLIILENSTLK